MDALETETEEEVMKDSFTVTLNGRAAPSTRVLDMSPIESHEPKSSVRQADSLRKPSIASLLDMLDDVQFSEDEEAKEDEYLVVPAYESGTSIELPIAPSKDEVEWKVDGEYSNGIVSDGDLMYDLYVC